MPTPHWTLHRECSQYPYTTPIHNTNIQHSYTISIYNIHTQHSYTIPIYNIHIQYPYTMSIYNTHVQCHAQYPYRAHMRMFPHHTLHGLSTENTHTHTQIHSSKHTFLQKHGDTVTSAQPFIHSKSGLLRKRAACPLLLTKFLLLASHCFHGLHKEDGQIQR